MNADSARNVEARRRFDAGVEREMREHAPVPGRFDIRQDGTTLHSISFVGLRPPFHRGVEIGTAVTRLDEPTGRTAARTVALANDRHGELVDMLRASGDRLEAINRRSGIRAGMLLPSRIDRYEDQLLLECVVVARLLSDSLAMVEQAFNVGCGVEGQGGWRALEAEAAAQRRRHENKGAGFKVDAVTAGLLAGMDMRQQTALARHLADQPMRTYAEINPPGPDMDKVRRACPGFPPEIETIRIRDGRLVGRVRLGSATTWNAGVLTTNVKVPETVMAALAGRRVDSVIQHDRLNQAGSVVTAGRARHGLKLVTDCPLVGFPFHQQGDAT